MVKHKFSDIYNIQLLENSRGYSGYTDGEWQECLLFFYYCGLLEGKKLKW